MYTPQHEITISPYPMGPATSPFIFGGSCSCKTWLWMPNTLANTMKAVEEHYAAMALIPNLAEGSAAGSCD